MAVHVLTLQVKWYSGIREVTYEIHTGQAWESAGLRPQAVYHGHDCDHDNDGLPCGACILGAADSAGSVLCRVANGATLTDPLF